MFISLILQDEPRNKRKRGSNKVTNSKAKGKATGKTRGRKPAANKTEKTPTKRGRKKAETSEEESEQQDDGSSSEDEPLAKKAKSPQPPTVSFRIIIVLWKIKNL